MPRFPRLRGYGDESHRITKEGTSTLGIRNRKICGSDYISRVGHSDFSLWIFFCVELFGRLYSVVTKLLGFSKNISVVYVQTKIRFPPLRFHWVYHWFLEQLDSRFFKPNLFSLGGYKNWDSTLLSVLIAWHNMAVYASTIDLFRLYISFSQYRSCDDTQEIWSFVLFIKKSTNTTSFYGL